MNEPYEITEYRLRKLNDFLIVFSTDEGKRVLEYLEDDFCGDCFVKGDPYATHVRIGENNAILKIKSNFYEAMELKDKEIKVIKEDEEKED